MTGQIIGPKVSSFLMKELGAAKFKEQCLALLEQIGPDGIVITKHGKPVAKLIPIETQGAKLLGCLKGKIKIKGKVFSTGLSWNAQS